jgi:hypothetical protein
MTSHPKQVYEVVPCPECQGERGEDGIDYAKVRSTTIDLPYKFFPCEKCHGEGHLTDFDCGECDATEIPAEEIGCRECADKHYRLLCKNCAEDPGLHSEHCKRADRMWVACDDCGKSTPYGHTRYLSGIGRVCVFCWAEVRFCQSVQPPEALIDLGDFAKWLAGMD